MTTPVVIAHLSDLHLGETWNDVGDPGRASLWGAVRRRRVEMQSHNPFILYSLRAELQNIAKVWCGGRGSFDFVVITGDISTNANSSARFTFARDYLLSSIPVSGGTWAGLSLDKSRAFCVPGNHDKMMELTAERYLNGLGDIPSPPPYCEIRTVGDRKIAFIGIDSNEYTEGNVGIGSISPEGLAYLNDKLGAIPDEVGYRILLLHHHPCDLNSLRSRSIGDLLRSPFTVMTNGGALLDACRGRVDLVMHGHEHFSVAFADAQSGAVVVSCGTTLEYHKASDHGANAMHVVRLDEGVITVQEYRWTSGRFSSGRRWEFHGSLGEREWYQAVRMDSGRVGTAKQGS